MHTTPAGDLRLGLRPPSAARTRSERISESGGDLPFGQLDRPRLRTDAGLRQESVRSQVHLSSGRTTPRH